MRNMLPLTTTVWLPPSDCVIYADSPCLSVTFVPTGTTEASTSRVKIFASLEFIKHLKINCSQYLRRCCGRNQSGLFVFRAHRFGVALERRHDGVPGQNRTFHPGGKFINA